MRALHDLLRRPLVEQPFALRLGLALAGMIIAIAVVAVIAVPPGDERRTTSTDSPSPVVSEANLERGSASEAVWRRRAREAARTFAAGYIDALYGRDEARGIAGATPRLRRRIADELIRVPPTRAELRPRIVGLRVTRGSGESAVAEVVVDDRDAPPYPMRFIVRERRGHWGVASLLSD